MFEIIYFNQISLFINYQQHCKASSKLNYLIQLNIFMSELGLFIYLKLKIKNIKRIIGGSEIKDFPKKYT